MTDLQTLGTMAGGLGLFLLGMGLMTDGLKLAAGPALHRILAGATDVLARWRQGVWKPAYVLNIKRIPGLDEVQYSPVSGLHLGALVTVRTLEQHPLIREHYPALTQAAAAFAGVQIRNLATVGGNVCNASPAGDTLPALLA